MDLEMELIPISEIKKEENTYLLPLSRLEYFAFLATTLTPLESFLEEEGYTSALFEYMQDKKYQEKELFTDYDKLIHAINGHAILSTLIQLFLIERKMRSEGISNKLLGRYQRLQGEYQTLLWELKKKS